MQPTIREYQAQAAVSQEKPGSKTNPNMYKRGEALLDGNSYVSGSPIFERPFVGHSIFQKIHEKSNDNQYWRNPRPPRVKLENGNR